MILIAGDSHGDVQYMKHLFQLAQNANIHDIIICGDFGYWPEDQHGRQFLKHIENLMLGYDMRLYFIDGNHEDFNALKKLPKDRVSMIPECFNVFYIPRGVTTMIDNRKVMGFGGAASIDRAWRVLGKSWFIEEMISEEDINNMTDVKNIDIMITHDGPLNIIKDKPGYRIDLNSEINRQQLRKAVMKAKPKMLFHGHYHCSDHYINGEMYVYALHCNYGKFHETYKII
jgi:Icc-related predicted phosphoesterase